MRLLIPDLMSCQEVVAIQNLMRQRDLLFKWLEVAESMMAFFTQHLDNHEELHAGLIRQRVIWLSFRKPSQTGEGY